MMNSSNFPFPCMEPLRCLLSCKAHDLRLSRRKLGNTNISVSPNRHAQEEWLIVSQEEGTVAFQCVERKFYLSSTPYGKVTTAMELGNEEKWRISASPNGGFNIVAVAHQMKLVCDDDKCVYTISRDKDDWGTWDIEFLSGELCFISSPLHDKRVKCDVFGVVSAVEFWQGWEVFRFIEAGEGHVFIASWTHDWFFLSSSPDGRVMSSKNRDSWEKWLVRKSPCGTGVELVSVAHEGRMLSCNGKKLVTTDRRNGKEEVWELAAANRNVFFISCAKHDKRITCSPSADVPYTHRNRKNWEEWLLEEKGEGLFTFRSIQHDKYLGSSNDGKVVTSWTEAYPSNKWRVEQSPHGGSFLVSNESHMVLLCNEDGDLTTALENRSEEATWHLEPRLPNSTSAAQMVRAATVTVGLAAAAPFAVMGVIGAMGFTSSGVAAGSIAGGMMSAEAIATGGGIAAGGTVATLQSVGAAGLGLVGTSAALSGGAAVGGSISAITLLSSGVTATCGTDNSNEEVFSCANRPFCAWKKW